MSNRIDVDELTENTILCDTDVSEIVELAMEGSGKYAPLRRALLEELGEDTDPGVIDDALELVLTIVHRTLTKSN